MVRSKLRPTEGEFDNYEDRVVFAKKYFWKLLIHENLIDELVSKLVPKFDKTLSFPQNERTLVADIRIWEKEHHIQNNQEIRWLESWILYFIELKARSSEVSDDEFQLMMVRDCVPRFPPTISGLYVWLYDDDSAADYIEGQRLQALDILNSTDLASLPQRVKTTVANERAKQAERYTKEVTAKLKIDNPDLKATSVSPRYEQHFEWLFQVYFYKKQFSEVAFSEDADLANVSREVTKLAKLLGFSTPPHIKPGRKKGSQNNPITSNLGKN